MSGKLARIGASDAHASKGISSSASAAIRSWHVRDASCASGLRCRVRTRIAVRGQDELARYERLLEPWVDQIMDYAVRIRRDLVTGFRLTDRAH